jgi:hypothetical protein
LSWIRSQWFGCSTLKCIPFEYGRLCRVFVEIYFLSRRNDFAIIIVTTGCANVVRALKLTAICAFIWVCRNKCVM